MPVAADHLRTTGCLEDDVERERPCDRLLDRCGFNDSARVIEGPSRAFAHVRGAGDNQVVVGEVFAALVEEADEDPPKDASPTDALVVFVPGNCRAHGTCAHRDRPHPIEVAIFSPVADWVPTGAIGLQRQATGLAAGRGNRLDVLARTREADRGAPCLDVCAAGASAESSWRTIELVEVDHGGWRTSSR